MYPDENIIPLAEDPLEKLKTTVFSQAINASPIALVVLGWTTDTTITEPRIEELRLTAGQAKQIKAMVRRRLQ